MCRLESETNLDQTNKRCINHFPLHWGILLLLSSGCSIREIPFDWSSAPLNNSYAILDVSLYGGKPHLVLAFVLNAIVFFALLAAFRGPYGELDESAIWVYFGIFFGSGLLNLFLSHLLGFWVLLVILSAEVGVLRYFCNVTLVRGSIIFFLYHAYQIGYILAYYSIQ